MLIADAVVSVANGVQRDLAVLLRQGNQFAAGMLFRGAAFVGIDMSIGAAQDRLERSSQSLQTENISAGSVESEKNCNVRTKMFFKFLDAPNGYRNRPRKPLHGLDLPVPAQPEFQGARRHYCHWRSCGQTEGEFAP